jgi:hypothetical protein
MGLGLCATTTPLRKPKEVSYRFAKNCQNLAVVAENHVLDSLVELLFPV